MEIFNLVSGICSITGLVISIISLIFVTSIKIEQSHNNINQSNTSNNCNDKLEQNNKIGGDWRGK